MHKLTLLWVVLFMSFSHAFAQNISERIQEQFIQHHDSFPQEKVYLHTDKHAYLIGETIWLKAYLMDARSHSPSQISNLLYVELIGPDGKIYCSDTEGNTIYAIDNGAVTKFVLDIESPNGLLVTEDEFSVVCWNQKTFYQVNPEDKSLKIVTNRIRGMDGLEAVGNGDYLVSSYFGKVYYVTKDGKKTIILDTSKEEISATDIDYIPELQMLLVPTMDANKVMAYRLEEASSEE